LFGYLHPATAVPVLNIVLLGTLALAGSLMVQWEHAVGLLNFGAFLSFMGVNLAAARLLWRRRSAKATLPALGFVFCFVIWINLPKTAWMAGAVWCAAGIVLAAVRLRTGRSIREVSLKEV
jgi:hypothetical protein